MVTNEATTRPQAPATITPVLLGIATGCLVVLAFLAALVWHVRGPVALDQALGFTRPSYSMTWRHIAYVGSPGFVFTALLAIAAVAFAFDDYLALAVCVLAPPLAALCELVAKPVVERLLITGGPSYPSGHVTLAGSLAAVLVFLAYRLGGGRAAAVTAVPASVLVVVASVAVVQVGWHYPTDTIGGVALSVGVVCATAAAVLNAWPRLEGRASWRWLAGVAKVRASGIDPERHPANERRGTYEDS